MPVTTPGPVERAPGPRSPADFERLVASELPRLHRLARAMLGSDDLAWDAIQETLLRAWSRGFLPNEPARALTYLVVQSSLHLLRCARRRRDHEALSAASGPCCAEDPLAGLQREEEVRVLRTALARMERAQRVVVELFDLKGESYAAIARRLDLPIGTVRSRLHRARRELREDLKRRLSHGSTPTG